MRFARRTWGCYLTLMDREHFKIKLLRFRHGRSMSKQRHKLRNELWLFLSGSGVTLGNRKYAGDFYYVQMGKLHTYRAVKNTWVLEIQYGISCEEADIERV